MNSFGNTPVKNDSDAGPRMLSREDGSNRWRSSFQAIQEITSSPSAVAKAMAQIAHSERGERVVCSHDDGSGGYKCAAGYIAYSRAAGGSLSRQKLRSTAQRLTINNRISKGNIYCTSTNGALEEKQAGGPPSQSNIGNMKVQSVFKPFMAVPFNLLVFFLS